MPNSSTFSNYVEEYNNNNTVVLTPGKNQDIYINK